MRMLNEMKLSVGKSKNIRVVGIVFLALLSVGCAHIELVSEDYAVEEYRPVLNQYQGPLRETN